MIAPVAAVLDDSFMRIADVIPGSRLIRVRPQAVGQITCKYPQAKPGTLVVNHSKRSITEPHAAP